MEWCQKVFQQQGVRCYLLKLLKTWKIKIVTISIIKTINLFGKKIPELYQAGKCLISKTTLCLDSIDNIEPTNNFKSLRPSPKQDARQGRISTGLSFSSGSGSTSGISGSTSATSCTSFQDFQSSVDDAWDSGDDEFCTVSDIRISKKVSKSAALSVINSHRSTVTCAESRINFKDRPQEIIPEEKKVEALQRLAVQPLQLRNANLRTAASKSNHDSHSVEVAEVKPSISPHHRHSQFPGRPQPLKQANVTSKFYIASKEQGN